LDKSSETISGRFTFRRARARTRRRADAGKRTFASREDVVGARDDAEARMMM